MILSTGPRQRLENFVLEHDNSSSWLILNAIVRWRQAHTWIQDRFEWMHGMLQLDALLRPSNSYA